MADTDDDVEFVKVISSGNAQKSTQQNNLFGCSTCSGQFGTVRDLRRHRCPCFGFETESLSDMETKHHNIGRLKKPFVCQLCRKSFKSKKECVGHFLAHINTKFCICPHCGKPFCKVGLLPKYETRVLGNYIKKDLCGHCSKTHSKAVRVTREKQQAVTSQEQDTPRVECQTNLTQCDIVSVNKPVTATIEDGVTQHINVKQERFQGQDVGKTENISVLAKHTDGKNKIMEVDVDAATQRTEVKQEVVFQEQDTSRAENSFTTGNTTGENNEIEKAVEGWQRCCADIKQEVTSEELDALKPENLPTLVQHVAVGGNIKGTSFLEDSHEQCAEIKPDMVYVSQEQDTRMMDKLSNVALQIALGENRRRQDIAEDTQNSGCLDSSVVHLKGKVVGKRLFVCNFCGKDFPALSALVAHCQDKLCVVANETSKMGESSADQAVTGQGAVCPQTVQSLLCHICGHQFTALSKHKCSQEVKSQEQDALQAEKLPTLIQHDAISGNKKEIESDEDSLDSCAETKQDVTSQEQDARTEKLSSMAQQSVLGENSSNIRNTVEETPHSGHLDYNSKLAKPKQSNYVVHLKGKEVGNRLFVCNPCGKQFTALSALKAHRRLPCEGKLDLNTGGKNIPIKPSLVAKGAPVSSELSADDQAGPRQEAVRRHTVKSVFVCNPCGREFTEVHALTKHNCMRESSRKSVTCCRCGKGLHSQATLISHLGLFHGDKLWCCSDCGKTFSRRSNMLKHKNHHSSVRNDTSSSSTSSPSRAFLNFYLGQTLCQEQTTKSSAPVCAFERTNDKNVAAHHKVDHVNQGRRHFCKLCGQEFSQISDLKNHTNCAGRAVQKIKHGRRAQKVENKTKHKSRKSKKKSKAKKHRPVDTDASVPKAAAARETNFVMSQPKGRAQVQKSGSCVNASPWKSPKLSTLRAIAPKPITPKLIVKAPEPSRQTMTSQPVSQSTSLQPVTCQPVLSKNISPQPVASQSITLQPIAHGPIAGQSFAIQSMSNQPIAFHQIISPVHITPGTSTPQSVSSNQSNTSFVTFSSLPPHIN